MNWLSEDQVALSVVDALTASICVIDHDGIVRAENAAWKQFSSRNGGIGSYIGVNYLEICRKAGGDDSEAAHRIATAIRQVLDGKRHRFEAEYPCHSHTEQRWFLTRATPLRFGSDNSQGKQSLGAVVSHQEITEKKLLEMQLKGFAETDELTGLRNRRSMIDHISKAFAEHKTGCTVALLLLDLDNFKEINDTSGHDIGDLVIKQVAERLSSLTSRNPSTIAARMGGDEFALLLAVEQPWSVVPLAEELLGLLDQPYPIDGEQVHSAASVGIAFYPTDAVAPASLLKAADLALYRAKNGGRNRYVFYTDNLRDAAQQRKKLFNQGRSGIVRNEFETYFQPIVSLKDKSLLGLEALIRWQHPDLGLITPAHFLPLLKDWGMGEALSQVVLLQVIQHLSDWPEIRISVNLTTGQLRNPNFVDFLCREILANSVNAEQLKLEITEDVVLGDSNNEFETILTRLRDAGFKISLDDFGTGYASLSHLSQFPLDEIKIDMSFVKQLNTSRRARSVVRSITHLAHELGLSVVAEGIEDREIEGIVAALGCDHGQGYLFGRPQPASAIPDIIKKWTYPSRAPSALPAPNLRNSSR
ncbi:EAL domain-containing protein (plasmid) [Mesorhizobium sp. NBSH29]|uniref:putative bifunctional diguanylate cyclase/phosphodiesterase n=1 Tax=Mesorhizobium sp. NBSH29 TaxID=2654249 RepID=UPI0018964F81|nr:EAL domain-containing protein [Mesorhizobium sp. NBSH29]QPC88905.1 EAL domain-containing protein [Mesorhizobium sp. NBSH29]QPC88958.1 EAL domain-containing protein [Mesorhizobium sp. NBSH29]